MATAASGDGTPPSVDSAAPEKESCVPYFDALWFCYSPGHQLTEFYRYGKVDDCSKHWTKFYNCLKKRTRYADQVESEDSRQPFWELRTSEEATHFWEREFDSVKTGLPNPQEPQSPAAKSPFISNERDIHVGNFFLEDSSDESMLDGSLAGAKESALRSGTWITLFVVAYAGLVFPSS